MTLKGIIQNRKDQYQKATYSISDASTVLKHQRLSIYRGRIALTIDLEVPVHDLSSCFCVSDEDAYSMEHGIK